MSEDESVEQRLRSQSMLSTRFLCPQHVKEQCFEQHKKPQYIHGRKVTTTTLIRVMNLCPKKNNLVQLIDYVLFCYSIVFHDDLINKINKHKK